MQGAGWHRVVHQYGVGWIVSALRSQRRLERKIDRRTNRQGTRNALIQMPMNLPLMFFRMCAIAGLLTFFCSPVVFATTVPSPVVSGSGVIQMIDGPDRGTSVMVDFGFLGRNRLGLEFGLISGDLFNVLGTNRAVVGSRTFVGSTIVDFAVRSRGTDGQFGTADDGIFRISDGAYVNEYFSDSVKASKSRNLRIADTYYETLRLVWDINRDGVKDLTVELNTRNYDGMRAVPSSTPVPLPAAMWLMGSGLVSLMTVTRRRRNKA